MAKAKKFLVDEARKGRYVRAWKERRDIVVAVWNSKEPQGEPRSEWVMPGILGVELAVKQALAQTPKE